MFFHDLLHTVECLAMPLDQAGSSGQRSVYHTRLVLRTVNSSPEPEFLNIYWRLKSRLFAKSRLFNGQRVPVPYNMALTGYSFCLPV